MIWFPFVKGERFMRFEEKPEYMCLTMCLSLHNFQTKIESCMLKDQILHFIFNISTFLNHIEAELALHE